MLCNSIVTHLSICHHHQHLELCSTPYWRMSSSLLPACISVHCWQTGAASSDEARPCTTRRAHLHIAESSRVLLFYAHQNMVVMFFGMRHSTITVQPDCYPNDPAFLRTKTLCLGTYCPLTDDHLMSLL